MFLETSYLFYYKIVFIFEILLAMFLLSFNLKKKDNFILRFILSVLGCVIIGIFFPLFKDISYTWWYSSIMFIFLFTCCTFALSIMYDVSWQKIFFISILAYTTQHFAHELYSFIANSLNLVDSSSMGIYSSDILDLTNISINILQLVLYLDIYVIVYVAIYFLFGRKLKQNDVKISSFSILAISFVILLTDVILNSILIYAKTYSRLYSIIICVYNILCCLMIFYIQFSLTRTKYLENELRTTSQLLHLSEEKYKESKENINLINIKCHDLKTSNQRICIKKLC